MVFLAKPNKPTDKPQHLRPIALQEPIGKAITGLLTKRLLDQAFPTLRAWPQFGYLPSRSAQDAINRVVTHCSQVRDLVLSQCRSVQNRMQNAATFSICGGLQMFLDLSRAFDSIRRPILFEQLNRCGVSSEMITLMRALHEGTQYHLYHNGEFHPIKVGLGVRQGCKAAPILWACLMCGFLQRAAELLTPEWVSAHITLYADDFHVGATFCIATELQLALHNFGVILDLLEDFGLTVNTDKSHVLFAVAGTNHRKYSCNLIQRTRDMVRLTIPRRRAETSLKVSSEATYLGVKLSYKRMEALTLQFRISSAQASFRRLRKWLTNRQLALRHRLALWNSCILTTRTYGLFTVGLQEVGLNKLQVTMYQMLRTIIGDHAYVTGNTHQQTLSQHRCATPLQLLLRAVQQQQRSVAQRSLSLDETDIVKSLQWTTLSASEQVILDAIHQGPAVPIHPDPAEAPDVTVWLQCPQCSYETNNTANMLRHYTNVHREQQLRTHQVDFSRDSLDGLPKCRYCLRLFTTWSSFKRHVERRSCQVPFAIRALRQPTTQPSAVLSSDPHDSGSPLRVVPRLRGMNSASDELRVKLLPCDLAHLHSSAPGAFILEVVNSMNWPQLLQDGEACRQLTSTCALCGIYVGQVRELLAHLKLYHADLMTHVLAKSAQLTLVHAKESPCRFCSKTFKTGHICPVMVQLALLLVNGGGMDLSQGMRCVRTILHCEICGADHDDVRGIQQHLREVHKLAMQDWNVSRDAVGGTQCAHCGSQHVSTEALRRHITFGHCSNFDYARSAETQPLDDDLVQALQHGTLSQLLSDTLVRSRLTLSCQCCGESYSRSPDLAAHLQLCHGRLWTQAVPLTNMLTDIVLREQGCVCNPSTSIPVSVHVCIGLKQTAMQFLRMPDAILVPFEHSETHLRRVLHQSLPAATVSVIAQNVMQRSFSALWQDPEIIQLLRQQCALCGKHFHAADIGRHLCQDHDCMAGFTLHFLKQIAKILEPTMLESSVCTACGLAFALLPGLDPIQHQQALKAHLSGLCPTVLQSATLLACKHLRMEPLEQSQLAETFQGMANLLARPLLTPGPDAKGQGGADPRPNPNMPQQDLAPVLHLLLQTVTRLDREMSDMQKQDSFVFFLAQEKTSLLHQLLEQATKWKQMHVESKEQLMIPSLRIFLMRHLAQELQHRVLKIHQADSKDQLKMAVLQKGIILADGSWPYQRWCSQQKCLLTAKQSPITAVKMEQICQDLIEALQQDSSVIQFHSLKPQAAKEATVPWRLKVSMRTSDLHALLTMLSGNAVWQIMGCTMKSHTLHQSSLGQQLQQYMNPKKGKGNGKGKRASHGKTS